MLITRNVRLLAPLLATKMNNRVVPTRREFVKNVNPDGSVAIRSDLQRWNWAFLEARDALNLDDVATSAIIPSPTYTAPGTSTYFRQFRRGKEHAKEAFESVSSGRVITLVFTLSRHLPPGGDGNGRFTRTPDEDEFDAMLEHIGEHLGMSEWGHAYLYGRFTIRKPQ